MPRSRSRRAFRADSSGAFRAFVIGVLAPHSEDDADINQPPLSNGCNFFGRRETRQYFLGPNRKKGVGFRSDDEMY
jgi:hypothetical protein